ncbi:ABC transporter substrate-binding protein [bacterium]|nr:ABC transporter substrate-binding protein [bacterium]
MKSLINRRRAISALICGMGGCVLPSRFVFGDQQSPYKRMFDDPLQFTGPDEFAPGDEYRIGVFSPAAGERSLLAGAQLAADEINQSKLLDKPMRLIQRWANDPWGAGSQELIKMAYDDNVMAIIGGPDSASTHIAQQIALKAYMPLLAPAATDPTLTEIRVPWIFRLPPNDDALSTALVASEHVGANSRIGMIYADLHDARMAATAFRKAMLANEATPLFDFIVPDQNGALENAIQRAVQFSPDAVWVWLHHAQFGEFARMAKRLNLCKRIFAQWKMDDPIRKDTKDFLPITFAAPFQWNVISEAIQNFAERFANYADGDAPSYRDAYCYDAIKIIAAAIQKGGVTRKRLRDAIAGLGNFEGVAGKYEWDNGGGNAAKPFAYSLQ